MRLINISLITGCSSTCAHNKTSTILFTVVQVLLLIGVTIGS